MSTQGSSEDAHVPSSEEQAQIPGDRGIPSVNRTRSLQSRVSNALALGLMSSLGLGFLAWYYTHAFERRVEARASTDSAVRSKAQSEMSLPPLGRIDPPAASTPVIESLLGPAPPLPEEESAQLDAMMPGARRAAYAASEPASIDPVLERRLKGPSYLQADRSIDVSTHTGSDSVQARSAAAANSDLAPLLVPTVTETAVPSVLPTQRLSLPKGAFVDCTLETALDSTLPGMATCVTATDTFSADGRVVLIERGTKLVGETRGAVRQGSARIFVLWTQARTPEGVVVPLASPGTDELGRSGLPGEVDRHFSERFGAAILISLIDGIVQGAVQSSRDGAAVIYNPSSSQDILTEVLRSTVSIPPTVRKRQGDRIQVLVARDIDFRSVYHLRAAEDMAHVGAGR
jgi:type IV secretion system protein VirB10